MRTSLSGIFCLLIIVFFSGCSDDSSDNKDYGPLKVNAVVSKEWSILNLPSVIVLVEHKGTPVDTATVQVNNITINHDGTPGSGLYTNPAGILVMPQGTAVTLVVSYDKFSVQKTLTMPAKPTVTAPTAGTYDPVEDLDITWNSIVPTPDQIVVLVQDIHTAGSGDWSKTIGGGKVKATIPGGVLAASTNNVIALVHAENVAPYLGKDTTSSSWYIVGWYGASALFDTQ